MASNDTRNGYIVLFLFALVIWFSVKGCFSSDKKPNEVEPEPERQQVSKIVDPYHFLHWLDHEYAYDVRIRNIEVTEIPNAFEIVNEKYGMPQKVDGHILKIKFSITNPYRRKMRIPFPYFNLASEEFTTGHVDRDCGCYQVGQNGIQDSTGRLFQYLGGDYDSLGEFKALESKTLTVLFDKPFRSDTVTFSGFNKQRKERKDMNKMNYEQMEKYKSEKDLDYRFVISVSKRRIIQVLELSSYY